MAKLLGHTSTLIFTTERKEVAKMAPNQLIQHPGKAPIVRDKREELMRGNISTELKLKVGLGAISHLRGLKILDSLSREYNSLKTLFSNQELGNSLVSIDKMESLSAGLYSQGLSLLMRILNTSRVPKDSNVSFLKEEKTELEKELESLTPSSTLRSIVQERLGKLERSISLVKSYQDKEDEVLCQASLCRDSMREVRLELPELLVHKPQDELDKVLLELRTRIDFAQRVREEYNQEGI